MRRMMSEWVSEPMSKSHVCVRVWNSPCTCYHFAVVPDVVVVIVWPIGANHNTAIATMSSTTKTVDDDARATRWETEDKEKNGELESVAQISIWYGMEKLRGNFKECVFAVWIHKLWTKSIHKILFKVYVNYYFEHLAMHRNN